jgi:predicted nucleotidyltransferase
MIMPNMGMTRKPTKSVRGKHLPPRETAVGLADALFSRTQQRVLAFLFGQPNRSFYASELIALAGGGSGAVQRELARLTQSGLVILRPMGKQKYYQANPESPLFSELRGIVEKTVGLAEPLRAALMPLSTKIHAAFVFGSIAKREDSASSDIDLMVLSDALSYGDLFAAMEETSQRLGRSVNPTILTSKELAKKLKSDNAFVTRVLSQPKIWLMGDENAIGVREPVRTG